MLALYYQYWKYSSLESIKSKDTILFEKLIYKFLGINTIAT